MNHPVVLGALCLLTLGAACAGNGGKSNPPTPALCDTDEIEADEARLWRSLLSAMEGVPDGCNAPAAPINAWLDEYGAELRRVTAEASRCDLKRSDETENLFAQVLLLTDPRCPPSSPVNAAERRLHQAAGVTSIPIPR